MMSRTVSSSSMTKHVGLARELSTRPVRRFTAGARLSRPASVLPAAGSGTVKVLPTPDALSTAMSPPMRRHSRRLMASPSPVPPYLRVVELSAWVNSWKSLPICSVRHADAGILHGRSSRQSRPVRLAQTARSVTVPSLGELAGVAQEIEHDLAEAHGVGSASCRDPGAISTSSRLPFLAASGSAVVASLLDQDARSTSSG